MPDQRPAAVPRAVRMADEVQRILGDILTAKVPLPSAELCTITQVEMTRDLGLARIYVSILNPKTDEAEVMRELLRHRKEIRYHLGQTLRAKYVPALRFYLDKSLQRSARIHAILHELHTEKSASSG